MAAGDILIVPAQAAGFISCKAHRQETVVATSSTSPRDGQHRRNGAGYLLAAQTGLSQPQAPTTTAASRHQSRRRVPASTPAARGAGYAKIVFSKNASVPNGYTASNSRKIGGFPCRGARALSNSGLPQASRRRGYRAQQRLGRASTARNLRRRGWPSSRPASGAASTALGRLRQLAECDLRQPLQRAASALHRRLQRTRSAPAAVHASGMREPTFEECS